MNTLYLDNPAARGAGDAYGALCSERERLAHEEAELAALFVRTVMTASRVTMWTDIDGTRNDWSTKVNDKPVQHLPTVAEVMFDYFEYTSKAPKWDDLMALLVRVAKAGDAEAVAMINKLGAAYGYMNAGNE